MRTTKQKIFLFLKITTVTLVTLVGTFYYFREDILRKVIEKVSTKLVKEYDCTINIKDAKFDGLSAVSLTEVSLIPKNADTLAKFQSIKTSVNFWGLLKGDIQLGSLDAKKGYIHLVKKGETSNYAAFFAKKSKDTINNSKRNYAELAYRIIDKVSNFVPTDLDLQDFEFVYDDNGIISTLYTDKLLLDDEDLETNVQIKSKDFTQKLRIYGTADPRNKEADVQFINGDKGKLIVPFVAEKYGLKSSFDSIRVNVDNIEMSGDELHIDGFTSIVNLNLKHPKISKNEVLFENLKMDYKFLFGENFMALDNGSVAEVNKIKFEPYLKYEKTNSKIYTLKVRIPNMKAQDFITSLPEGLFTNFKGMEVAGNFSYSMSFKIDKKRPWNLRFNSNINKNGLKITKYGKADIGKLNGEFEYTALIDDKPQRPVFVGEVNPDYYPLTEISPFLEKAVITFEDPNFYSHKGFEMNAFRASMVKNMASNRFERGGSTISMQLIKNAFLKREKTISRKLEEILLCYVMENNKIVSKNRILEVYFNIIEWGPNVYGIGEASRFYFQKKPADLTLNECMFLASIVPMPQKFMNQFEGPIWKNKFARRSIFMKNLMLKRGIITPEEMDSSSYVNINGPARSYLDFGVLRSTPKDSTSIEEFEF
jgi:Transglycosylase